MRRMVINNDGPCPMIQCFNDKLRRQRGSTWGDASKDPIVKTMQTFTQRIHREHSSSLDFAEFSELVTRYVSLFEPAFAIWAALVRGTRRSPLPSSFALRRVAL